MAESITIQSRKQFSLDFSSAYERCLAGVNALIFSAAFSYICLETKLTCENKHQKLPFSLSFSNPLS